MAGVEDSAPRSLKDNGRQRLVNVDIMTLFRCMVLL